MRRPSGAPHSSIFQTEHMLFEMGPVIIRGGHGNNTKSKWSVLSLRFRFVDARVRMVVRSVGMHDRFELVLISVVGMVMIVCVWMLSKSFCSLKYRCKCQNRAKWQLCNVYTMCSKLSLIFVIWMTVINSKRAEVIVEWWFRFGHVWKNETTRYLMSGPMVDGHDTFWTIIVLYVDGI